MPKFRENVPRKMFSTRITKIQRNPKYAPPNSSKEHNGKKLFRIFKEQPNKRNPQPSKLGWFRGLRVKWNPETKQITDGHQCLEAKNKTVSATNCEEKTAQQWLLEAPKRQESNTLEENQPLLSSASPIYRRQIGRTRERTTRRN